MKKKKNSGCDAMSNTTKPHLNVMLSEAPRHDQRLKGSGARSRNIPKMFQSQKYSVRAFSRYRRPQNPRNNEYRETLE
jgi:hypothetical protein